MLNWDAHDNRLHRLTCVHRPDAGHTASFQHLANAAKPPFFRAFQNLLMVFIGTVFYSLVLQKTVFDALVMILMNLLVAVVAGLILFEPFTRTPISRSIRFSQHRSRAMRAFCQAGAAIFAALIIATSNPSPQQVSPNIVFGCAAILAIAGVYWAVRGKRLLKPGKMFATHR